MGKTNTEEIIELLKTRVSKDQKNKLEVLAKKSFLDYLASVTLADKELAVEKLKQSLHYTDQYLIIGQKGNLSVEQAALLNGFTAHYLDFDDVQANFRGHPSVVIFSALLAVSNPTDKLRSLLQAFVQGVELAGHIGRTIHPGHALQGWHSTGTIGTIAAAAAIGVYKKLPEDKLATLLSFAASQASGMMFQEGSDAKPMQAGLAARNAVAAYKLTESGLTATKDPFNNHNGWLKTISGTEITPSTWGNSWLSPAQIENPGIWFKQKPFCSAAISGYDATRQAYEAGIRISNTTQFIFHYPENGDRALTKSHPLTGQEGKFSIEYIAWCVLENGDISTEDLDNFRVSPKFETDLPKFSRQHDLPSKDKRARPVRLEVIQDDKTANFTVINPKGSPLNPLDETDLQKKLVNGLGDLASDVIQLISKSKTQLKEIDSLLNYRRYLDCTSKNSQISLAPLS
ncbi:hypothetical protein AYR62_10820 [Secundilactobacillus paracollinoides]|uniref:MmgE/PrpD N-terminal domain-containing protein n=1 Tax=Secundilactobacillus paracollinoides TaxID=240427 RepID=A0A1B2IY63_9LACO|nr:MmgE/PrpD family protein [Secundilactobacillus paracollinoides]ANZ61049.1 hypothetical protein AYR61_06625 [Secundilactobacillus paracollinoides]ANZ64529.1 hypothetical protein AYR62_10820 [Secundilactobacillus paracollinoides]ANZ66971.1 hypothetical protein AYR63_07380 [Secundilactobacillus paracollinoides]KRL77025.1 hypothetical protein FC17_GL001482 [Secundilactobacillus paracollinoides DSM 15502 = JCM 11969]